MSEQQTERPQGSRFADTLFSRLDATDKQVKAVADALENLQKAQKEEALADPGTKEEEKAEKKVEKAEEQVEKKAEQAGLSDEDINRIADALWERWDTKEAEEAKTAAGDGKTELEKLEAGEGTPAPVTPAGEAVGEGQAAPPEQQIAGEEKPADSVPKRAHWSQRRIFGGGDD